jgi:hypothetical protein
MSTLGELKARIRLETSKDDIAQDGESAAALTTAIKRAIDYYAEEPFWFNLGGIDSPPAEDASSNIWTSEAEDLIAARVRMLLYRDLWRDEEGMQMAATAEADEKKRLQRETARRGAATLKTDIALGAARFGMKSG